MEWTKFEDLNLDEEEIELEIDGLLPKITESEEKIEEEVVVEENEENDEELEAESKKKTRRDRRIQSLSRKIKQLETENAAEKTEFTKKLEEFESKLSTNAVTAEADQQISNIETRLSDAKQKFARAKENSDYTAEAEAQEQISGLSFDLRIAKARKQEKPKTETKSKIEQKQEEYPDAYNDWVEDKDWFLEPSSPKERKLKRFLSKKAKEISDDGVTWDTDEFYEELDEATKNYLKKNKLKFNDDELIDEEQEKKPKTSPTTPTTRGSSITKDANGKLRIKLTKDEREMADKLGVSYKDYALEKLKIEKSSNGVVNAFE